MLIYCLVFRPLISYKNHTWQLMVVTVDKNTFSVLISRRYSVGEGKGQFSIFSFQ